VDLGNSLLIRGKQAEAEKYLGQALDSAQRGKARRNEARARQAMASLRQQQGRPDEAVQYLQPALAFYQQGGYQSEAVLCLLLMARANFQRGDYPAAAKSQDELLQLAQQLNDQALIARAHAERGSGLVREEKFTEALDHLNQAYAIYSSQGIQRSMGHNLVTRGDVQARLGRFDQAKALLDQGIAIADRPGGEIKRLSLDGKLVLAEIALTQGNFADARSKAEKIFEAAGEEFKGTAIGAKIVIGLAQSYGGATAAGKQAATEAFEMAKQLQDPAQLALAQMALAETQLLAGDSRAASGNALQADDIFARLGQPASEWRALVIAAQASHKLGDKSKAREYAMRARDSLSKLEQRWGSENYNSYLSRPDVQRFRKQVDQLAGSV
jgi:tetratricopeptide (TPR) repeat protein